jgi:hypothetical protein
VAERRHEQPETDQHERGEADPADGVVRQVQAGQNDAAEEGEDREAQRQAADDEIRPLPGRLGAGPRAAAAEEDDGKDRQDTRGQARDDPADQAAA